MTYQLENLPNLLIEQYKGSSKVILFIQELQQLFETRLNILCQLEKLHNPEEAFGIWLDYIGLRLGIVRPSVVNIGQKYFGFDTDDANNNLSFDQGPIQSVNPDLVARIGLADSVFLKLIRARARFVKNNNYSSLHDVREAFNLLFVSFEITSFTVQPYSINVVIHQEVNSEYFRVVNENLDMLVPRPAGVQIVLTHQQPTP